jgi:hypothetical protein
VQLIAPNEMRGRVMASTWWRFAAALPLGSLAERLRGNFISAPLVLEINILLVGGGVASSFAATAFGKSDRLRASGFGLRASGLRKCEA